MKCLKITTGKNQSVLIGYFRRVLGAAVVDEEKTKIYLPIEDKKVALKFKSFAESLLIGPRPVFSAQRIKGGPVFDSKPTTSFKNLIEFYQKEGVSCLRY